MSAAQSILRAAQLDVATLRLEIEVRDYDLWRGAFERDAGGRQQAGMRCYPHLPSGG